MKISTFFFILLFCEFTIQAQNWRPILADYKCYWLVNDSISHLNINQHGSLVHTSRFIKESTASSKFYTRPVDSNAPEHERNFFRSYQLKYINEGIDYSQRTNNRNRFFSANRIGAMLDTIEEQFGASARVEIKKDTIIFGQIDSIVSGRYFQANIPSNFRIILSKKFGLLQYVHFIHAPYEGVPIKLAGIEDLQLGLIGKDFRTRLPKAGDEMHLLTYQVNYPCASPCMQPSSFERIIKVKEIIQAGNTTSCFIVDKFNTHIDSAWVNVNQDSTAPYEMPIDTFLFPSILDNSSKDFIYGFITKDNIFLKAFDLFSLDALTVKFISPIKLPLQYSPSYKVFVWGSSCTSYCGRFDLPVYFDNSNDSLPAQGTPLNFTVENKPSKFTENFKIIPNPTNAYFTFDGNIRPDKVEFLNFYGQVIKTFEAQEKYNIMGLSSGIYLVKIITSTQNRILKLQID